MKEFLSKIKNAGAFIANKSDEKSIVLANNGLQSRYFAMLPLPVIELYKSSGGISLGDSYIFGPTEFSIDGKYPVPSILEINNELTGFSKMRGLTIFARNDLFWFAFNSFGDFFMLDNITLNTLKKYDDFYLAATDCLMFGKM